MIEAIIATIGTIIGTIVGFLLSECSTKRREERNEKRQAQSVRTVISLEIDRNLSLLQGFWNQMGQAVDPNDAVEEQKVKLARRFVDLALPEWKREVLDSQLPLLAVAFLEQEMTQVFQFYDCLSKVEALRNGLATVAQEETEDRRANVKVGYGLSMKFSNKALSCWDECESLVIQLINNGNPLRPKQAK